MIIVKEATVVGVDSGTVPVHRVTRLPFARHWLALERRRESCWLQKYYHGIDWDVGDVSYEVLITILRTCLTATVATAVQQ